MSQRYANHGGDSGVVSTETARNSIIVRFQDGSSYLYNNTVTGQGRVRYMRQLAQQGQGLNSYINRKIGRAYAGKW